MVSVATLLWPLLLLALVTLVMVAFKHWHLGASLRDISIRTHPDYVLLHAAVIAGTLPLALALDVRGDARHLEIPTWAALFAWAALAGSVLATGIFLASPSLFTALGKEDRPVEYASALAALVASGLFVVAARSSAQSRGPWLARAWLYGLAVVLFLIAGEEISWGQRILGFGTPEEFAGNIQGETNLHNFATWTITTAYYAAGFMLLILVPFLLPWWKFHGTNLARYLPSPATALVAATLIGFEYNRFGTVLPEVMTAVTVLVLAVWFVRAPDRRVRALVGALIPTIILMQLIFLTQGDRFVRGWDATEYRELLIALGFLAFALEVVLRRGRRRAG